VHSCLRTYSTAATRALDFGDGIILLIEYRDRFRDLNYPVLLVTLGKNSEYRWLAKRHKDDVSIAYRRAFGTSKKWPTSGYESSAHIGRKYGQIIE
jgi:hypothetical protein